MIILEGTDAVGKTSVIKSLSKYELSDRDKDVCRLFSFDVSLMDRIKALVDYFNKNDNSIIFLINNNRDELERRIKLRGTADKYDKYAYLYNILYFETYLYAEIHKMFMGRLFMVDCTGLSLEDETKRVENIVNKIIAERK